MIENTIRFLLEHPEEAFSPAEILKYGGISLDSIDKIVAGFLLEFLGEKFLKQADGKIKYLTGGPVSPLLIEKAVKGTHLAGNVISYVETDSTNDIAWGYGSAPANSGLVVLAESQRAGRGRFTDRKWHDRPGMSILMSVLIKSGIVTADVLGIAAAVAITEAIRDCAGLEVTIKWPNDIVYGKKKLAGIMVEARTIAALEWFVLGLGVNCNQNYDDFPAEISHKATSIMQETGMQVDRDRLIIHILDKLDTLLARGNDRETLARQWSALSSTVDGNMVIQENGTKYEGVVTEVEPFQGVTLRLTDGTKRFFDARTASVVAF